MPKFGFDDWMDAQLRQVPLPRTLFQRLRNSSGPSAADEKMDILLRNVAVPIDLESRLKQIVRPDSFSWYRASVAAAIFFVAGLSVLQFSGILRSRQQLQAERQPQAERLGIAAAGAALAPVGLRSLPAPAAEAPVSDTLEAAVARQNVLADDRGFDVPASEDPTLISLERPAWTDNAPATPMLEATREALGAAVRTEPLPDLQVALARPARGVAPPRVRGYDSLFHLQYGEHPFVAPAAHPDLATVRVPLTRETTSFDDALQAAGSGKRLSPDQIRVEDFLAAVDSWPRTASNAAPVLHVAGSRWPGASAGLYQFQCAIAAPSGPPRTAARNVKLTLNFNPKVVTGYRLLGHEAASLTGAAADPLVVDLESNQNVTAMFELWIKPGGNDPPVAVELNWQDVTDGRPNTQSRAVQRSELAQDLSQAPWWHQHSVLAAKTAEALRGSFYAASARPLAQINDVANETIQQTNGQGNFGRLLELIRLSQQVR